MPERDSVQPDAAAAPAPPAPAKPRRKWLRRAAWSCLLLICLLLLAALLGPTIASTSIARRFALSQINRHIGGTLEISDWSIGWISGMRLQGVCLYDRDHLAVASVDQIQTHLSLWNALHGKYLCGDTQIAGPNLSHLVIYKDGSTNLEQILRNQTTTKPAKQPKHLAHHTTAASPKAKTTTPLPLIAGNFYITALHGTILHERLKGPINIEPSDIQISLNGPGQPTQQSGKLALRMAPFASNGTVEWSGKLQIAADGQIDTAASQMQAQLTFDHFESSGFKLDQVNVPLRLDHGNLCAQTTAPIICNGGKLDLSGLKVDWRRNSDPRLNTSSNYLLLSGASINPLLGDSLGKFINPVFTNARRAEGKLDLTLINCNGVALSKLIETDHSGACTASFSIKPMDIVNPLGSQMIEEIRKSSGIDLFKILGIKTNKRRDAKDADVFDGQIDNGIVKLARGRIDEDITLQLSEPSTGNNPALTMALRFVGEVKLHDQSQKLDVTVPPHFVSRSIGNKQFAQMLDDVFPDGIPISLRGSTKSPKLDVSRIIARYKSSPKGDHSKDAGKQLNNLLDQLAVPARHKSHGNPTTSTQPTAN